MAARIMGEADGGQILVGDPVHGILRNHDEYTSAFKHHPSVSVKHRVLLNIYQFVKGGLPFLNTDVPSAFRTPSDVGTLTGESLPKAHGSLRSEGLTIRVEIGPSEAEVQYAKLMNLELKPPLTIIALIDTGASTTVINPEVAITCGLRQIGSSRISTTGQVLQVPEYVGAISFPDSHLQRIDPARFVACSLPGQHFSCLLGRDVLEKWKLTYDGRTGEVVIQN